MSSRWLRDHLRDIPTATAERFGMMQTVARRDEPGHCVMDPADTEVVKANARRAPPQAHGA